MQKFWCKKRSQKNHLYEDAKQTKKGNSLFQIGNKQEKGKAKQEINKIEKYK